MAYWKLWGNAFTCSECNMCNSIGGNFCINCGAKISDIKHEMPQNLFSNIKIPKCIQCSHCGEILYHMNSNIYCPNCGADMRDTDE